MPLHHIVMIEVALSQQVAVHWKDSLLHHSSQESLLTTGLWYLRFSALGRRCAGTCMRYICPSTQAPSSLPAWLVQPGPGV